ncbi:MAG: tetratricopeptide repeat protein [Oligoflexia bacterium]|nr:tetratricopeptide repeat protein [Oligoflexia bacterium]MBF0364145.1 tetratricopeptide repeat protein [Oligoflexia bacterium]
MGHKSKQKKKNREVREQENTLSTSTTTFAHKSKSKGNVLDLGAGNKFLKSDFTTDNIIIFLIIFFATFILYSQAINHPFNFLDDNVHIYENPHYDPVNFKNLLFYWTNPYFSLYIPLTYTLWGFEVLFTKMIFNPPYPSTLFHINNIILHFLNTSLIFLILKKITPNIKLQTVACFLGALFFMIHPMQVESVVWVAERRGLQCLFFALLGIYYLTHHYKENSDLSWKRWFIFFIFVTLSMLSKPTGLITPIFAFIILMLFTPINLKAIGKLALRIVAVEIMVSPLMFAVVNIQLEFATSIVNTIWEKIYLIAYAFHFYFDKFFIPQDLSMIYNKHPSLIMDEMVFPTLTIIFLLVIITLLALTVRYYKKHNRPFLNSTLYGNPIAFVLLGIMMFIAGLLPTSGITQTSYQQISMVADRYIYFAMFGAAITITSLLYIASLRWRQIFLGAASVWILVLAFLNFNYASIWKNNYVYASYIYERNPDATPAIAYLFSVNSNERNTEKAHYYLRQLSRLTDRMWDPKNRLNIVKALIYNKEYSEAERIVDVILKKNPVNELAIELKAQIKRETATFSNSPQTSSL